MSEETTEKKEASRPQNVHQKLAWVQSRIRVTKDRGKGHDREAKVSYEFRNAEDILERAKPLCAEIGAHVTVDVSTKVLCENAPLDIRVVGKDKYGNEVLALASGPRVMFVAEAVFTDVDSGESWRAHAEAEKDWWRKGQSEPEKLSGSADSYASKYALAHLFALDNNRDADMESNDSSEGKKAEEPLPEW